MDTERYRVPPGTDVKLAAWDTRTNGDHGISKDDAPALLTEYTERLAQLQQLLYAGESHKMLVVLQGMDTSGKDGTIKHVFRAVNPLGVRVANFKKPNDVERRHDFLWRVHHNAPLDGQLTIFNRSHYEDVLVVRIHGLASEPVWHRRYDHIVNFEQMLTDEGTVIRKFFLHISKDEQKARLQERLDNPAKHFKFEHGDIEERKLWDDYQRAYEDALTRTSTTTAPWYIVPSDQKWFRNLVISKVLIETLEGLDMRYPEAPLLSGLRID
jgi:PPK2 family polyphosphate:nucleotide phosphotransferase